MITHTTASHHAAAAAVRELVSHGPSLTGALREIAALQRAGDLTSYEAVVHADRAHDAAPCSELRHLRVLRHAGEITAREHTVLADAARARHAPTASAQHIWGHAGDTHVAAHSPAA